MESDMVFKIAKCSAIAGLSTAMSGGVVPRNVLSIVAYATITID
jgi:hypothetical protein